MKSTTMTGFGHHPILNLSTTMKLTTSYLFAYLIALSTVGILYLLGLFDVGFLSPESLAVKLIKYAFTSLS